MGVAGVSYSYLNLSQGGAAVLQEPPVTLSPITSLPRLTCVRRSGATRSRRALSLGTAGGVCRSGLSLLRATPTWLWPASLLALPRPGNSPVFSWPSRSPCHSFPESPFFSHTHACSPPAVCHAGPWQPPSSVPSLKGAARQRGGVTLRPQDLAPEPRTFGSRTPLLFCSAFPCL